LSSPQVSTPGRQAPTDLPHGRRFPGVHGQSSSTRPSQLSSISLPQISPCGTGASQPAYVSGATHFSRPAPHALKQLRDEFSSPSRLQLLSCPSQSSYASVWPPTHPPHVPSAPQVCSPKVQVPTLVPHGCFAPGLHAHPSLIDRSQLLSI